MRPERYESFYNLAESPFSLTPDPRFLFRSKGHHDILQAALYGLETQKGIIAIVGEVGTGKTTLCRALLKLLPPKYRTGLVLDPHLSEEGLVRAIAEDLGLSVDGYDRQAILRALEQFLLEAGERGECAVALLDEAQKLSPELLEQVRILSNLETPTRKLLQIVLVGQPELDEKLLRHDLRQLNQRIGVRCHLTPLSRSETVAYVEHRLRLAGLSGKMPLTRSALRKVWNYSKGIPRLINLVCDRAFTAGFVAQAPRINSSLVTRAIHSLGGVTAPSPLSARPSLAVAGLVALLAGGASLLWQRGAEEWWRQLPAPTRYSGQVSAKIKATTSTPTPAPAEESAALKTVADPERRALLRKLLGLWGIENIGGKAVAAWPTAPGGSLDIRLVAARYGLEAELLASPAWSEIEAIRLPAILDWQAEARPSLLIRLEPSSAVLFSPAGEEATLSLDELKKKRLRSGWFLWRNQGGWTHLPTREWSPRIVTLFAARLNKLDYLDYPLPSSYDEQLRRAVRRFQQDIGLAADGILGPRTAMGLMRLTSSEQIPRLDGEKMP